MGAEESRTVCAGVGIMREERSRAGQRDYGISSGLGGKNGDMLCL